MKLRPPQVTTLNALAGAIREGHRKIIIQAATGMGKTVMAARIIAGHRDKGGRPIFVAPAVSLIDQTVERLVQYGIPLADIGVIQADHPMTDYAKPVQVASIQTLSRRKAHRLDASLVIVDECHQVFKAQLEWMAAWYAVPFIGLSATPFTKGLGKHWDHLVHEVTIGDLIEQGYLSPYRIYAASHPDLKGVRTKAGDFHEGDLSEAMQRGALVGDTARHWRKHGEGRPTLVFAVDRAHAKALQQEFEAAGIGAGYVDAYTERDERQAIADQFHAGDLQVVCSVGCLTTGIDWDVRCIVLARPTKSPMLYLQIIGRGLRPADGKDYCLVLDHSDTAMRLGFPEEVEAQHSGLDDGTKDQRSQRESEPPKPKECPSCGYLKAPKVHQCPACGFAPEKRPEVEEIEAELKELTKHQRKLNRDMPVEQKAGFHAELLGYAQAKGYAPGWAAHKYKERLGVWPRGPAKHVQPKAPGPETMNYIKHLNIKNAKRRAA